MLFIGPLIFKSHVPEDYVQVKFQANVKRQKQAKCYNEDST